LRKDRSNPVLFSFPLRLRSRLRELLSILILCFLARPTKSPMMSRTIK
jgi:hypothetical protein